MPRLLLVLALSSVLLACSREDSESPTATTATTAPATSARSGEVPAREQEDGLLRCGEMLMRMEEPAGAPTFSRLMRECGGLFAQRRCRDALASDAFSREAVATACRADYCGELRPAPSFCTTDMPTDAEFLVQFAGFSRPALRRDLQRIMDREGADEIAELFSGLVEAQSAR